jgi:hypothetical protein
MPAYHYCAEMSKPGAVIKIDGLYQTDTYIAFSSQLSDLRKTIADNFSGYPLPAIFSVPIDPCNVIITSLTLVCPN